jgi:hypothetical protein
MVGVDAHSQIEPAKENVLAKPQVVQGMAGMIFSLTFVRRDDLRLDV